MTKLPKPLQHFKTQAHQMLSENWIGEIQFSHGTYQIQFINPESKKECWAFLQIDPRGKINDCFCSCDECEENLHCPHLAAGYLYIFQDSSRPLHERFKESLWNALSLLYDELTGDHPNFIKKGKDSYVLRIAGKDLVLVRGKTSKGKSDLKEIIEERHKETEETSLKFSNLSEEELALYRKGRPSKELRYELSVWYDLAQILMLLQVKGKSYQIDFSYDADGIPNEILIDFEDIFLSFKLSISNLSLIIPALKTVESPIQIHYTHHEGVEKILFDKEKQEFEIIKKKKELAKETPGTKIDGWTFFQGGFYKKESHTLFDDGKITKENIPSLLNEHFHFVKKLLQNSLIHKESVKINYTLAFDAVWSLHIKSFLHKEGDLNSPFSQIYKNWLYLDEDGFYPIEDSPFLEKEVIIPKNKVGDFVSRERTWLNNQLGFSTHIGTIESSLNYILNENDSLSFERSIEAKEQNKFHDFDSWVYLKNVGFFSKSVSYSGLALFSDLVIPKTQIPLFIHANQKELELIPHFFSSHTPLERVFLKTEFFENDDTLQIEPIYEFKEEYQKKEIKLFDDFTYVKGEGFSEIPVEMRLKEVFQHPLNIEEDAIPAFLDEEESSLNRFHAHIDQRLKSPNKLTLCADEIEKVDDFYKVKFTLSSEYGKTPVVPLYSAIKKKRKFAFTSAGCIHLTDRRFDWLKQLHHDKIDKKNNVITLTTLEIIRLDAFEQIETLPETPTAQLLDDLKNLKIPGIPNITGLKSVLRPYQLIGVHWLWFLYIHKLSGLLCDEMGLGKTHQAMALLAAIKNNYNKTEGKLAFLVVCPTSVIYHWEEKLNAFFPELKVLCFHGQKRNLDDFKNYDLLLTSYGIYRIEQEKIKKYSFEIAVFDEIQIAKNHRSRLHHALKKVDAKIKIGLTGTPIENYLRELKSLFDLVLPSYMPSDTDYRELFLKPIEKENNPERKALLKRFINPFMLRRKKHAVLSDLPEKTEEISHCDLSVEQQHLYNQVLEQSRSIIHDKLRNDSSPIPYMHIFAILSNLKQICNHPAIFLKDPEHYKKHSSGKWDLFLELFHEAQDSGQKIVIFSQYLMMLDIFKAYLNEQNVQFAEIRGSTINRGEEVHRFNNDPNCKVFIGSLQAAGLGIDLTGASVVIHYDRWWNAARENQATDRVHRIGQTRGVQVFKLVTKNSFEERIDALITKKAKLMEEIVMADDHRFVKQFSRDELLSLLQEVQETIPEEFSDE